MLVDRTMYVAGQLGMDPSNGQLVPGGAKAEAKQVRNLIGLNDIWIIFTLATCSVSGAVQGQGDPKCGGWWMGRVSEIILIAILEGRSIRNYLLSILFLSHPNCKHGKETRALYFQQGEKQNFILGAYCLSTPNQDSTWGGWLGPAGQAGQPGRAFISEPCCPVGRVENFPVHFPLSTSFDESTRLAESAIVQIMMNLSIGSLA